MNVIKKIIFPGGNRNVEGAASTSRGPAGRFSYKNTYIKNHLFNK